MHYIRNVTPLLVCSMREPVAIALLPVPMLNPRPSADSTKFAGFYKPLGKLIPLHEDDALRVRKYMQRFDTECLTSDGQTAFTLNGNQLMECDPTVCGQPHEPLFINFYPQYWVGESVLPAGPAERIDVTEKVLDSLAVGCVPVYWGADNVTDIVPADCFVDRRAFRDTAEVHRYLQSITDAQYLDYQAAIRRFFDSAQAPRLRSEEVVRTIVDGICADLRRQGTLAAAATTQPA